MSDRPQPQPSRDQGTESSMSAFNDGTLFHDPRRPGNAGERSSNTSGPRKLDFNTRDLIADMDLPPGHSRKYTLIKRRICHQQYFHDFSPRI